MTAVSPGATQQARSSRAAFRHPIDPHYRRNSLGLQEGDVVRHEFTGALFFTRWHRVLEVDDDRIGEKRGVLRTRSGMWPGTNSMERIGQGLVSRAV